MRLIPTAALLSLLIPGASMAQAPSLDVRGLLSLEPGTTRWGFETTPPTGWTARAFADQRMSTAIAGVSLEVPLEGERALRFAPDGLRTLIVDLRSFADAADRSVDIRIWQRSDGTRVTASVTWAVGDLDSAVAGGDLGELLILSQIALRPTQHRTDDGWQQWSTGTIDFALAQRILPLLVLQDHGQSLGPAVRTDGHAWVDAVEVADIGPARTPNAGCSLVNERTTCGPEGRCWLGRCVDARAVEGPDFASAEHRQQYFEKRRKELEIWAGHRKAQAKFGDADLIFAELQRDAPVDMWTRIGLAYEVLEDGHAARPRMAGRGLLGAGICAHLGEADLHPQPSLLPLIYRVSSDHPLGTELDRGDVIETIDGLAPSDWRDLVRGGFDFSGDADTRDFVETSRLMGEVMWRASTLTVRHCTDVDAPGCAQVRRAIDVSALVAPIWQGTMPEWVRRNPACDARFNRAAGDEGAEEYIHAASGEYEGLAVLQANGTPGPGIPGWEGWRKTVESSLAAAPSTLIFDERRGDGGTFVGVHLLSSYFFAADEAPTDIVVPPLGAREDDVATREAMVTCAQNSMSAGFFDCGGMFWASPAVFLGAPPAPNSLGATKLAVLTGIDGSGNDWLTHHLRIARTSTVGETRVFGPVQLQGAYGEVVGLPFYDMGIAPPRIQWTGGVIVWPGQDDLTLHVGGEGVVPDQTVFQKQSDAVRGIDTQLEEARRWLTGSR